MMLFDNPGVFVFTNFDHADYIPIVLISIVVSALVFIAFMYTAITKEIRHTVASKSSKQAEDRRRSLNNLVVQVRGLSTNLEKFKFSEHVVRHLPLNRLRFNPQTILQ